MNSMTPQNSEAPAALDTAGLRAKAEAATAGPWIAAGPSFGADRPTYLNEVLVDSEGDEDDGNTVAQCVSGTDDDPQTTADMDYIAAANPSVILALLDERDDLLNSIDRAERTLRMHGFQDTGKPEWERAEAAFNPDWANYRQGLGDGRAQAAAGAVPEGAITGDEVTALAHKLIQGLTAELGDCEDDEALNYCARGIGSLNADILTFIKNRATPPAAAPSEPVAKIVALAANSILHSHKVSHMQYEDGEPYSLVDLLSAPPPETIASGRQEIEYIVDAICAEFEAIAPAFATPPAQDAGTGATANASAVEALTDLADEAQANGSSRSWVDEKVLLVRSAFNNLKGQE